MNLVFFLLHLTLVSMVISYFIFTNYRQFRFSKNIKLKFIYIFFIAIFINFFRLKNFPFVAIGDEIRDGALDAAKISSGELKNIFGYGSYNAHGSIIPTFNSIFFKVFGNSVLSYRIPTALIGSVDIILLFFITTYFVGSIAGFWAALTLTCLPLHLFYSRTETVVIFSSLLTTILIYFAYRVINKPKDYIYLAILIGFSFNFHASVKTVAILLLPVLFMKILSFQKFTKIIISTFISVIAIIVGFGPTILRTTPEIFFNYSRFNGNSVNFVSLIGKYFESLKVIAFSPTTSHYFDHQPLVTIPLFVLFIIGLICLFIKKKNIFLLLTYLLLAILFTNSAITDLINADHRLIPLLPIISIIVGTSLYHLTSALPNLLKKASIIILFLYLTSLAYNFFDNQKANINDYNNWREPKEYLSMHLIYLIKNNNFPKDITIYVSRNNSVNFNYLHYQEQYRYFLPDKNIVFLADNYYDDHTAALSTSKQQFLQIDCKEKMNRFFCPLNDTNKFSIYY